METPVSGIPACNRWPPQEIRRHRHGPELEGKSTAEVALTIQIHHILCPVDFSEFSRRALDHAIAMAKWYEARLTMLHVFVNLGAVDLPPIVLEDAERERLLAEMRRFAGPPSEVSLDLLVLEAPDIRREILHQIDALHADLLVIGSHGRTGFERLLLGSVTERVIRKAACPVMVVPRGALDAERGGPVRFTRILCPVDFSEGSLAALAYALSLAQEADSRLTVMHAIEIPPELAEDPLSLSFDIDAIHAAARAARLQRLRELIPESAWTYCTVETTVKEGAAYRQILTVATEQHSDLIVMGVHGRGAMDLLVFGSNTARVARAATCPVLVVHQAR